MAIRAKKGDVRVSSDEENGSTLNYHYIVRPWKKNPSRCSSIRFDEFIAKERLGNRPAVVGLISLPASI